jgi:protein-S-isoprenylcysteine O-methyltransferase Ste14
VVIARPLPFVWPYALAFWAAYVWSFIPELRFMRRGDSSSIDSGSMRLIVAGMQVAMLAAFAISFFFQPFGGVAYFWVGIALLLLGSALRRHCFRVLGEYFTYAVKVSGSQPVIDRGAYRWVRHPSYTGAMMMFAGLGLALGNWASLIVVVATAIGVYAYRVTIEERALCKTIGEPYRAYMATRKRFIPFVF